MNNAGTQQESALGIYGGLVAELNPVNLPEGSAAICCDMDFTVGSVKTRYGVENVYAYEGSDEELEVGAGVNVDVAGGEAWSNPTHIELDDPPNYASVTLNATPGTASTNNGNDGHLYFPSGFTSTFDVTVTTDDILAGDIGIVPTIGAAQHVTGVVDSLGNVYSPVDAGTTWVSGSDFGGATMTWQIWHVQYLAKITVGTTFSITITYSANTGVRVDNAFINVTGAEGIDEVVSSSIPQSSATTTFAPALTVSQEDFFMSITWPGDGLTSLPFGGVDIMSFSNAQTVAAEEGPGLVTATWEQSPAADWAGTLIAFKVATNPAASFSDLLSASGFGFSIPADTEILGVQVEVKGLQTLSDPGSLLTLTPIIGGGAPITLQLPTSQGSKILGGPNDTLGMTLTPALVNGGGFGFLFQATDSTGEESSFNLSAATTTVWYTPPGSRNFTWVDTYDQEAGGVFTLALDDSGVLWQEDVVNDPNVLTPIYTSIEPDTFAKGAEVDDREFIALSNLINGTDMPRQWNGQWLDRVSQVGPGAPPSFTATATEYDIVSITQPPAVVNGSTGNPIRALLWSSGPGVKNQKGTIITVEYTVSPANQPDPNIYVGGGVVLSGFNTESGNDPNGSYIVISVQTTNTGNSLRNSFSVQAPTSFLTYDDPPSGASYQSTLSTVTLSEPASGIQVGSQILIAGTSVTALDEPWTVLFALNAAQLNITGTSLASDVATYDFTLISGTLPVVGQAITVTGTTNGNGIFNVVNAVITAASPSSFSIEIDAPNVSAEAEEGASGVISGTEFQFDPAPTWVGTTPSDPTEPFIFGTSTGGTIVQPGQLGAGPRQGVVLFLTRNGFLTPASPYASFTLAEGANAIIASNIPIGPPNVIARVIALTGANGGFYFWIPQPVTVTSNGQLVTYDATIINDNSTTTVTLNITDAVLLAAASIDSQGSNNFEEIELGSCLGFISYSQRIFAWGEQNKIQNLINLSFDGGYQLQNPNTPTQPAGWTIDPTNGGGGQLLNSPLFGNSYYIKNTTGSTQALYGMITQTAFQDQLATPIIEPQTEYSVRVTARCPSGVTSGNLVIDLFSPSFNKSFGLFSIPLASMTDTMQIFTGTLLTTAFATTVPADLLYRIYAQNIPNGGDVEIDRSEPFDASQPVLSTQLRGSYLDNFEAFDDVTGNLGVAVENQQAVTCAFELFDNIYIVKTGSFVESTDNGITEPDLWTVKEVSNKVGTPSINGVDVGEGWALIAGLPGVYLFEGGKPQKISPEIDPLWQAINWTYGYTLWIRNDTNNRRISIGVPLATPNQWMPNFPVNENPTSPNVVLTCTYKELMTASALASEGSIRQGYTGQLRSFQLGRRWSVWSIEAAYADFIERGDTTTPLFYCSNTGNGKIYQQITGNYLDDGEGLLDLYVTYPFLQTQEAQQIHAGLHELLATYASMLIVGEGNVDVTILPDTLQTPYGDALAPIELGNPPPYGDTEFPLNDVGNRFFVQFESHEPGDWFELSRFVMTVKQNPWAPVRGGNF
jgi:hypothetical protein